MMGRSHGMSGLAAGLGLGAATGVSASVCFMLGGVGMACAYIPDLDHRRSTATNVLPPVTWGLSWLLRKASRGLYAATKGPSDENCSGEHRHLTHTVAFALVLGVAVWWSLEWLLPSLDGDVTLLLGAAVMVGCVTHCLGDAITHAGCPFLWLIWPFPIAGETWYEFALPSWRVRIGRWRFRIGLSFATGKRVEKWLVFPALAVAAVLLVPGVWPVVWDVLAA